MMKLKPFLFFSISKRDRAARATNRAQRIGPAISAGAHRRNLRSSARITARTQAGLPAIRMPGEPLLSSLPRHS
jgi:hypothetical protein